jgi:hypothetical protein
MKKVNLNIINHLLLLFCMSLLIGSCKTNSLGGQNNLTEKISGHWFYDEKTKVFSFDSNFNNILDANAEQLKKMNKEQIQHSFGKASYIDNLENTDGSRNGYFLYYYLTEDCLTAPKCRKYFFKYDSHDQLISWNEIVIRTQY